MYEGGGYTRSVFYSVCYSFWEVGFILEEVPTPAPTTTETMSRSTTTDGMSPVQVIFLVGGIGVALTLCSVAVYLERRYSWIQGQCCKCSGADREETVISI